LNTTQVMLAASIMLLVTGIALLTARRLRIGSIIALISVGLVLGPHSPYPIFTGHVQNLQAIGEIGVILLLFVLALDIKPSRLWAHRRLVFGLGTAQYFAASCAITLLLSLVTSAHWRAALILGLGFAMSSSAIALPLLVERGERATNPGRAVVGVEIFQSFMVAPVLALIPVLTMGHVSTLVLSIAAVAKFGIAVAGLGFLALVVLPRVLRYSVRAFGSGAFTLIVLGGVLMASWMMDSIGVSAALGAFIMGVQLSTGVFATQIKAVVAPSKQVLLALFFISIGMAIDPIEVLAMKSQLMLFFLGIFAAKLIVGYAVSRLGKMNATEALMASLLLAPLDEVAYVIFAGAKDGGLLDAQTYSICLSVLSLSFMVSPLAINLGFRLANRSARLSAVMNPVGSPNPTDDFVLLIGYGNVGRVICELLTQSNIPYLCIDDNLSNVTAGSARRQNVHFGYVSHPSSLASFGIARARLVVIATEEFSYTKQVLMYLREFHGDAHFKVAVTFLAQRDELRAMGVKDALALMPEGALTFGRSVLQSLGIDERRVASVLDFIASDDYAALRTGTGSAAASAT